MVYRRNGCVAASTRELLRLQGFEYNDFIQDFLDYQLEDGNEDNIHMLGVLIVLAKLNIVSYFHTSVYIKNYILTADAYSQAFLLHDKITDEIASLVNDDKIFYEFAKWDVVAFSNTLHSQLRLKHLGLVFIDWDKWAVNAERKVAFERHKNPKHVISLIGTLGENFIVYDPAVLNPIQLCTPNELFNSLTGDQQVFFIKNTKEVELI